MFFTIFNLSQVHPNSQLYRLDTLEQEAVEQMLEQLRWSFIH